jgi:hypothetical protein
MNRAAASRMLAQIGEHNRSELCHSGGICDGLQAGLSGVTLYLADYFLEQIAPMLSLHR